MLARYDYDDLGRRTLLTRGDGVTTAYGYGAGPWLLSQDINASGANRDLDLDFTRNPAGQILTRAASNTVYSYAAFANVSRTDTINGLNQITTHGGVSIGRDANGNHLSDGTQTYTFDELNHPDTVKTGGARDASSPTIRWSCSTATAPVSGDLPLISGGGDVFQLLAL